LLTKTISKLHPYYEKTGIDSYPNDKKFVFSVYGKCDLESNAVYHFNISFLISIDLESSINIAEIEINKIFKISHIKIEVSQ